jgi:hypothetical protein
MARTSRPRIAIYALLIVVLLTTAACAAGPNTATAGTTHPAGFWLGLWHGVICPIAFLVSLFNDHVSIYEVHNNGNWYNFGFVLGILIAASGGSGLSRSRS